MFLTRGHLHHEGTWTEWFRMAAGLLPRALVQSKGCEEEAMARIASSCAIPEGNATVIQQQRLFQIYIHVGLDNAEFDGKLPCLMCIVACDIRWALTQSCLRVPLWRHCILLSRLPPSPQASALELPSRGCGDVTVSRSLARLHAACLPAMWSILAGAAGFPPDSIWHGLNIPERVKVEWGRHSMVDATRALLRNALENPLNQKFILLSEAGIPLYPPGVMYHQLITESKSRLMACVTPTVRACCAHAGVPGCWSMLVYMCM